jgi:hypothetical protein
MSNRSLRKRHKQARRCRVEIDPVTGNKIIHMNEELRQAMKAQLARFKEKFGREPGPNDPVFFDPDEDTPQPIPEWKIDRALDDVIASCPPEKQQSMREFVERAFPERKPAKMRRDELQ